VNFSGYFPIYRDIIDHTVDGRLSNNEALVLVWLTLLADKETGSYTINGPTLRAFLPGLTKGGAQRTLESLQQKRYIYRDVTPRSPLAYPYWVEGFKPTIGIRKELQLDLSEVFTTKDISKRRWVTAVPATKPATKPDGELDTEPDGANYNEKEKKKDTKKGDSPIPIIEMRTTTLESNVYLKTETANVDSAPGRAMAHSGALCPTPSQSTPQPVRVVGLKWSGRDGGYLDASGRVVPFAKASHLISTVGLEQRGSDFFEKGTGNAVPWQEAQQRISGSNEEGKAA
jgi:hypothetical protein